MPRSPFGRDLWNVYDPGPAEPYLATRATLTAEREARRWASDRPHLTVHATDPQRAIRTACAWIEQERERGANRPPQPWEEIRLHTATGVPVLVPPPRW
jgi:hypothetical protein